MESRKENILMKLDGIRITWLGHATFLIETPGGKKLIIDPWITGNPRTPDSHKSFDRIDVILCTHGHGDHIGDVADLAGKHNPTVVGIYELCAWARKKGAQHTAPMNKGGTQKVGDIKVTMVNANHSSAIEDGGEMIYGGEPCGYVIEFENGLKVYHAGDTNVFGDMAIIHELYKPDVAMLPVGDIYTMGPCEAAYACRLLKPKAVIPMHWGTFPALTGTPDELARRLREGGMQTEVIAMKPGETIS
jgi:L-ascorbate metabolism protein UlaG (beta-lactamase superfamily)